METDQILDLFNFGSSNPEDDGVTLDTSSNKKNVGDGVDENDAVDAEGNLRQKGKKGILDDMGELWDEKQYEEEFDIGGFLSTMKA